MRPIPWHRPPIRIGNDLAESAATAYLTTDSAKAPRRRGAAISVKEGAMNFRPLADRVLVRRIDAEERTAAGIIIPDTVKEKPQQGEVLAVGPGVRDRHGHLHPPDVEVGDRVLFGKWSGTEIKIDGEELVVMRDVLGVVAEPAGSVWQAV
jgi:chaperonin GroES